MFDICCFRIAYKSDKKLAEVGDRVEKLQPVAPRQASVLDHAIWMVMKGGGTGKLQWRYVISLRENNSNTSAANY